MLGSDCVPDCDSKELIAFRLVVVGSVVQLLEKEFHERSGIFDDVEEDFGEVGEGWEA